jgi:hypothetical protein
MSAIFLSGPMSGIENFNYPAFNAAAAKLRAQGHSVLNPAENPVPSCGTWAGYMRLSIAQLMRCEIVAVLDGWQDSSGAVVEVELAMKLGIPVRDVMTMEPA